MECGLLAIGCNVTIDGIKSLKKLKDKPEDVLGICDV